MDIISLLVRPAFIIYIGVLLAIYLLPLIYKRDVFLASVSIPFLAVSVILAILSSSYTGDDRAVLVAASALFGAFPLVRYPKAFMSISSNIRGEIDPVLAFENAFDSIFSREWEARCVNENELRLKVSSKTSEIVVSFGEEGVRVEGTASPFILNLVSIFSLASIGYGAYVFLTKFEELDVARFASTITALVFLIVVVLALIFNGMGFIDAKVKEVAAIIIRSVKDLEKSLEFARALEAAKKIKERGGAGR